MGKCEVDGQLLAVSLLGNSDPSIDRGVEEKERIAKQPHDQRRGWKKGNRAAIRISCSSLRSWRFQIVGRGFATIQYLLQVLT